MVVQEPSHVLATRYQERATVPRGEQRYRGMRWQSPREKAPAQKKELVAKLEAVEKRYDLYSGLYRQYTADLLRLCMYVRGLGSNERLRAYLQEPFPGHQIRLE